MKGITFFKKLWQLINDHSIYSAMIYEYDYENMPYGIEKINLIQNNIINLVAEKPFTISALSEWLSILQPHLIPIINNLEKRDIVRRYRLEDDRRFVYVTLGEYGKKLLHDQRTQRMSVLTEIIDSALDKSQRQGLLDAYVTIIGYMEKFPPVGEITGVGYGYDPDESYYKNMINLISRLAVLHNSYFGAILEGSPFSKENINLIQNNILECLDESDMTMKELANALGMLPSNLTPIINSMVTRGILERYSGNDRRFIYVRLSPRGKKLIESEKKVMLAHLQELLSGFTDAQLDEFENSYMIVTDHFNRMVEKCHQSL